MATGWPSPRFTLHRADIADKCGDGDGRAPATPGITHIVHLAAQAGVRYSMLNPYAYVHSNVMGHLVMLETARLLAGAAAISCTPARPRSTV